MLRIRELKLLIPEEHGPGGREEQIRKKAAEILHLPPERLHGIHILRHGIDARKKPLLYDVYTVDVELDRRSEDRVLSQGKKYRGVERAGSKHVFSVPACPRKEGTKRPVIAGAGPAGLFCALVLAEAGLEPVLLERGDDTADRDAAVLRYRTDGTLDPESNIQFGMGGAGTYSDGKLYTGIKDPDGAGRKVLETLVSLGAPEDILFEAHPHIGTDVLKEVMAGMRVRLEKLGAEIRFRTRLEDLAFDGNGVLCGAETSAGPISTEALVLATGHSARDTIEKLEERGISMEQKAFAVGFRVAHPQSWIDLSQYGRAAGGMLPPAVYKLTAQDPQGRGVYSFCMCPGGKIVNASSEAGMLCVNGMSERARDGTYANSALVIQILPEDYRLSGHPLEGVAFQRELERKAYLAGNGTIPVMSYGEFAKRLGLPDIPGERISGQMPDPAKAFCAGYREADLSEILPAHFARSILSAVGGFGRKIRGYDDPRTLFAGVETRTSSPVRIPRDDSGEAKGHPGVYPCGEGAGYAGGIVSAAVDGIHTAEKLIRRFQAL